MTNFLITGLGNPEGKYFQTWHNLGFLAIDQLAQDFNLEFKKKGNLLYASITHSTTTHLIKPLTYMNRSGEATLATIRKYKIAPQNLIILVDDLFIDKGNIRIVRGGSHAGHNGIKSINDHLKNHFAKQEINFPPFNYIKIKIGIKPDKPPHCTANYVLDRFKPSDLPLVNESLDKATQAMKLLLAGESLETIQGKFNCKNN